MTTLARESISGLFRGVCVDNKDPEQMGRIRVQVPQILGSFASGWAFPAWSVHDLTIWPQDRLPKPGDGVWVMFESTSPDKMIWIAAFGVPQRPVGDIDQEAYLSTLVMDLESQVPLEWGSEVTVSGRLTSAIGVPNPNAVVYLMARPDATFEFQPLGQTKPDVNGDWQITFDMYYSNGQQFQAVFGGAGLFPPSGSEVVTHPPIVYPVTLSWVVPTLEWGVNKTFTGTISSPNGLKDGMQVHLETRPTGTSTWTRRKTVVADAAGNWSLVYACDIPNIDMRVVHDQSGPWAASETNVESQNVATTTTVSTPSMSPSTAYYGTVVTATGTIKDSLGANVTSGQAQLQYQTYGTSGWGSWTNSSNPNSKKNVTNGSYSLQAGGLGDLGYFNWRVVYTGAGQYLDSTSGGARKDCNIANMGNMTKSTVTHSSARMKYGAIGGATGYDLDWHDGSWKNWASTTSRDVTRTGLGKYRRYYFRVRPYGKTMDNRTVYGGFSPSISMHTGRPEVRDKGTSGYIYVPCTASGSWRTASNNDWGQRGDKILQGAYSGYQQYGYYRGLIDYGHQGAYKKVKSALGGGSTGDNRINNGSVVSGTAEVFLYKRCGVGTNGAITLRWYRTNTAAGSSPGRVGSAYDRGTTSCGNGGWIDIGNTHGNWIVKGKNRGMTVQYDSTASSRYGEFNGRSSGSSDCDLRLKWTWNYVKESYVAPKWY